MKAAIRGIMLLLAGLLVGPFARAEEAPHLGDASHLPTTAYCFATAFTHAMKLSVELPVRSAMVWS